MNVEGALLAGGSSRRMGRDKAELELAGERVKQRLLRLLRARVAPVRIIGRSPHGAPPEHVADLLPGLGPLGGVYTALATARPESEAVLVVGCDLPFAAGELLDALLAALREDPAVDAVVPWPARGPVPVCAVYRTRVAPALRGRLETGALRARAFVESLNVRPIGPLELEALDPTGRSLFNMNDPSDYEAAVGMLAGEDASDGS